MCWQSFVKLLRETGRKLQHQVNFKVVITVWKRDSCQVKCDRSGRAGSCDLVLLKHQARSKQALKQRCWEVGCHICSDQAGLGSRLPAPHWCCCVCALLLVYRHAAISAVSQFLGLLEPLICMLKITGPYVDKTWARIVKFECICRHFQDLSFCNYEVSVWACLWLAEQILLTEVKAYKAQKTSPGYLASCYRDVMLHHWLRVLHVLDFISVQKRYCFWY